MLLRAIRSRAAAAAAPLSIAIAATLALPLAGMGGCQGPQGPAAAGRSGATGRTAPGLTRRIDIDRLQAQLMGYADSYMVQAIDLLNRLRRDGSTEEIRLWALRSRLNTSLALMTIATDPSPIVGAINVTVFATLRRQLLESYWIPELLHAEGDALLVAARQQESEAWLLVGTFLTQSEQDELRELMVKWREDNPGQRYVSHVRFDDFMAYRLTAASTKGPTSIFQLLFLDPFAGADPIAAELRSIRQLSERVFYFVERTPVLVTLTADSVFANLTSTPQARQALDSIEEIARSSAAFASFAEDLPRLVEEARAAALEDLARRLDEVRVAAMEDLSKRVSAEREATIAQISGALDRQRAELLATIERAGPALQPTIVEVRGLLEVLEQASVAVREGSDAFARIPSAWSGEDEPSSGVADDQPSTLAEVTSMFEATRRAAAEMRDLLRELEKVGDRSAAGGGPLAGLGASAIEAGDALVERILRAGLILVGALGAVLVAAPLIRRGAERVIFREGREGREKRRGEARSAG
ncbi:MAG TPA: hypothetical protein PKC43_07010 [Phycisphaerales bacterium]|nr:hypothetical protein [Phycisphaerales bacterium]HMP37183.1 hypothetical protein [Phycisphaerales bacterium]